MVAVIKEFLRLKFEEVIIDPIKLLAEWLTWVFIFVIIGIVDIILIVAFILGYVTLALTDYFVRHADNIMLEDIICMGLLDMILIYLTGFFGYVFFDWIRQNWRMAKMNVEYGRK